MNIILWGDYEMTGNSYGTWSKHQAIIKASIVVDCLSSVFGTVVDTMEEEHKNIF